jgi:hypothetical protein
VSETKLPHSAYRVWQRFVNEDFKKMAPGLSLKPKGQLLVAIGLILGGLVIGGFGGLILLGYVHPPVQLLGICQSPAQLTQGGCYVVTQTVTPDGKVQTNYAPAGYLLLLNGTRYRG